MIFRRVLDEISSNQGRRKEGKLNCIPWLDMPKFSTVIPGVQKEKYIEVSASPKVGKTKITDFMFVHQVMKFILSDKNTSNFKIKIPYFSLEVSKEQKIREVISYKLFEKGIELSPQNMLSLFNDYVLSDELKRSIESIEPYIEEFEKHVIYIDNIRNSYGIYKYVRDLCESLGKHYDKEGNIIELRSILNARENKDEKFLFKMDHFKYNDSEQYVEPITDHISLLNPQKDEGTVHNAINNFSNNHCLSMRDKYKCAVVNIHQQVATQEELKYSNGKLLIDTLRPSVDGLADSKYTSKDVNILLSLFAPYRAKIPKYPIYDGYDINKLGDKYRELAIVLNRDGGSFINVDLLFNGATGHFKELPKPSEINYETLKF